MPLQNPYAPFGHDEPPPRFSPAKLPAYAWWAGWGFLHCWWQTRQLGRLLQGVPAIALSVLLGGLLISRDQPVASQTIDGYLRQARQAMQLEAYDEAEFYFRKLEQLAPQDREVVYEHALLNAAQDDYVEAFEQMESLVEDSDTADDKKVHLWLARTALEKNLGLDQPLEFAKRHLLAVLKDDPQDRYAHYFFAQLYLRQRNYASGIEHLQRVASYLPPQHQLLLSSLYLKLDPPDPGRARATAKLAVERLTRTVQTSGATDVAAYHQLAVGYVLLGDFEKAISVLERAITKFDREQTRRELSRAYVAWADDVARKAPDDFARRLRLLEKAMMLAPDEPLALNRMLAIASAQGPGAVQAEEKLRQALVEGIAPAAVHFALGGLAAKRGDSEAAMRHFQQSSRLNPKTAVTLNNIAYLMSQSEEADMEQALEMVDQALEMAPSVPAFRDTRGQILVRMGRWSEGISDLEYANTKLDNLASRIVINRSLAKAYEALGDRKTAAAYRAKYNELLAQSGSQLTRPDDAAPEFEFKEPLAEDADATAPTGAE